MCKSKAEGVSCRAYKAERLGGVGVACQDVACLDGNLEEGGGEGQLIEVRVAGSYQVHRALQACQM